MEADEKKYPLLARGKMLSPRVLQKSFIFFMLYIFIGKKHKVDIHPGTFENYD